MTREKTSTTLTLESRKTLAIKIAFMRELNSSISKQLEAAKVNLDPIDPAKFNKTKNAFQKVAADVAKTLGYKINGNGK